MFEKVLADVLRPTCKIWQVRVIWYILYFGNILISELQSHIV